MRATGQVSAFHFKAALADGSVTTGQIDAVDHQHALTLLRQSGIRPIRLQPRPLAESWLHRDIGWLGSKTLSARDCGQFCGELRILLEAGLELREALESTLTSTSKTAKLPRFAASVLQRIKLGKGFSTAVEEAGFHLPTDVVPVLKAGEEAGALTISLGALSEALKQRGKLSADILSAMAYPIFLLAVVCVVLGILATFVAPALGRLFVSMDRPPPVVISLLWRASDFAAQNLVAIAVGVALILTLAVVALRSTPGRSVVTIVAKRLPLIGGILTWSAAARFASALKLSVVTNVATALALERALASAGVSPPAISRSVGLVRQGSTLQQAVGSLRFLPPKAMHLLAVGEKGGRLAEVLQVIVEEARDQSERRTALIGALLGPALIVLVGAVVGLTVFSIFSALMEVNSFAS